MSRIQIRQKIKTATLGMAIVLGILANSERGNAVDNDAVMDVGGCLHCNAADPAPEHG
jgi:hypothetical protein